MRYVLLISLILGFVWLYGCSRHQSDQRNDTEKTAELVPFMGRLERISQKLGFAIMGRNSKLAEFYLHELHEMAKKRVLAVRGAAARNAELITGLLN